jgi:hypothetical protein
MKVSIKWTTGVTDKNVPWSQPEEHDRVELVNVWHQQRRQEQEENDVTQPEVGREETHLGDLAEEFTAGLRKGVPSKSVPLASPPCYVGRVGTEFTRQCQSDDDLEEQSLKGDNGNHTENGLRETPTFQEVHGLEEGEKHDDSNTVSDGSEDSTEFLAA